MALNNIEYIDREYARCLRNGKSRVIKARMSSFRSIADRFTNFRIRLLENKLEKMKDKSLEEKYSKDDFSKKIDKKTKAMAKLEEKIMVLSKEDVPNDFVSKRAIKLKKSMIDNLTFNSDMFYTIGLDKKEEIFGDLSLDDNHSIESGILNENLDAEDLDSFIDVDALHEVGSSEHEEGLPELDAVNITNGNNIDVVPDDITRQAIADVVNAELDGVELDGEALTDTQKSSDDSLNGSLDASGAVSSGEMSKEEVKEVIENAFKEVELSHESDDIILEDSKINDEVDSAIERIRVSQNNSSNINTEKYDPDGEVKPKKDSKYQYVPMTDEEIRESQRKLGFDENGNMIESTSSFAVEVPKVSLDEIFVPKSTEKREAPIVVEDRKSSETPFDLDSGENMFDVIDTSIETHEADTQKAADLKEFSFEESEEGKSTTSSKLDDYLSLKDKILQLQRQKQISHEKKIRAEREAAEKAEKAQEVKKMFEDSQRTYEESLERLRAYTESLEEECEINSKDAEIAENDAQMSENFIEIQQKKADDNYRVIREIDGIINGESEDSTGKAK